MVLLYPLRFFLLPFTTTPLKLCFLQKLHILRPLIQSSVSCSITPSSRLSKYGTPQQLKHFRCISQLFSDEQIFVAGQYLTVPMLHYKKSKCPLKKNPLPTTTTTTTSNTNQTRKIEVVGLFCKQQKIKHENGSSGKNSLPRRRRSNIQEKLEL